MGQHTGRSQGGFCRDAHRILGTDELRAEYSIRGPVLLLGPIAQKQPAVAAYRMVGRALYVPSGTHVSLLNVLVIKLRPFS
jgi:hypothetical protein